MNKADLAASIAAKTGFTKKDSEKLLDAFVETVQESLSAGKKITLAGFGTFDVKNKAERMGVNPKTKEPMKIAATRAPSFKISQTLKAIVAEK